MQRTLHKELRNRLWLDINKIVPVHEDHRIAVMELINGYAPNLFLASELGSPVLRMCRVYLKDTDQLPDKLEFDGRNGNPVEDYRFPRLTNGRRNFAAKVTSILATNAMAKVTGYQNSLSEIDVAIAAIEKVCSAVNASDLLVELNSKRRQLKLQMNRFIDRCPWLVSTDPDVDDDEELECNLPTVPAVSQAGKKMRKKKAERCRSDDNYFENADDEDDAEDDE